MKKFSLKLFLVTASVCLFMLGNPIKVNAALQSNGGTPAKTYMDSWILQIRQMQEFGGTLGRTDTIDTTNLTSSATDLDIHMEKNTEYGAMAILSASAYGNPNKIENGGTTTGNSTGIVININYEWVAALDESNMTNLKNAASRYKNIYSKPYVPKIGDAITETEGWHGSYNKWMNANHSGNGVIRSFSGSIFSYDAFGGENWEADVTTGYATGKIYASRACIVVGTGI